VAVRTANRRAANDLLAVTRPERRGRLAAGLLGALLVLGVGVTLGRATSPGATTLQPEPASEPGPVNLAAGVPSGFERSEAGAVAAAANYTVVLGGKANLDPAYGETTYHRFALPEARDDLLRRAQDFAATVEDAAHLAADPALALRAAPLGYRVEQYSADEAIIDVWYAAVGVGTAELPMTTAWGTDRFTLRWAEGDWKVASITGHTGPEPPTGTEPDAGLAAGINGFHDFTYLAGQTP
jgi:hypothetical protein